MKKKKSPDAKRTYGFSLRPSLAEKVKQLAWKKKMSTSAYVQEALEAYMKNGG